MYRSIIAILLGCLFSSALWANSALSEKKEEFVMILSSYSYEKEWNTALAKEIRNRLEMQRSGLKVNITYADITGYSSFLADRFSMQGAFANGRLNLKIFLPDVLVLVGDESWMLYRIMNLRGLWGTIPVVLCGVHSQILKDYQSFFPDKQLEDTAFISLKQSATHLKTTAVIEPDNARKTVQLAQTLVPNLQNLYYLTDGSYGDAYMEKKLRDIATPQGLSLIEIPVIRTAADSTIQTLSALPARSVLLTNGVQVPQEVSVPVLTLRDTNYGERLPLGGFFAPLSSFAEKTAHAVLRIMETGEVTDVPYTTVSDVAFHLNKEALLKNDLSTTVALLPGVIERNVPPSFLIRHIRAIVMALLIVIVLTFVVLRTIHSRRYRQKLHVLYQRYKTLYGEYHVVYENMPVGLMLFDTDGNLLNRNSETDTFFRRFALTDADSFQLFQSDMLDEAMHRALLRKELVTTLIHRQELYYRVQGCLIIDEETGHNHILIVLIDNTDIERERKAKEQIYNVLNFAMNKAVIGVAEYNLLNGQGFATDAWYDTLDIARGSKDFGHVHQCLVPSDRNKVADYLAQVRNGRTSYFLDSVQLRTRNGETHYIRYLIQPLEYAPHRQQIIVAEMVHDMDEQIAREQELETAMKKAQEADRFKNAFVANMKDEIRVPLNEIIECSQELVACTDMEWKATLNRRIEAANNRMLELLHDIIELTKVKLNE